jgi:hypothetical protein
MGHHEHGDQEAAVNRDQICRRSLAGDFRHGGGPRYDRPLLGGHTSAIQAERVVSATTSGALAVCPPSIRGA